MACASLDLHRACVGGSDRPRAPVQRTGSTPEVRVPSARGPRGGMVADATGTARRRTDVRVMLDGLWFTEGPRWHDGALWFSDMHGHRVMRSELDGTATT